MPNFGLLSVKLMRQLGLPIFFSWIACRNLTLYKKWLGKCSLVPETQYSTVYSSLQFWRQHVSLQPLCFAPTSWWWLFILPWLSCGDFFSDFLPPSKYHSVLPLFLVVSYSFSPSSSWWIVPFAPTSMWWLGHSAPTSLHWVVHSVPSSSQCWLFYSALTSSQWVILLSVYSLQRLFILPRLYPIEFFFLPFLLGSE